jgi:decaprenylphospho-beta-D-erythro-pentofuranosid-2-ulose 2-reductase
VLIWGATSAIAREIARLEAKNGASLFLVGRDAERLGRVAADLPGAREVWTERADFLDFDQTARLVDTAMARMGRVDAVYIAHGDLGDQLLSERDFGEAARIFQVNCLSAIAILIPTAKKMEAARHGRIIVITSVAADRGRPRNFTYGAAKAALNVYLQGLRSCLYDSGVIVTTIRLGPVDTPMTRTHEKNLAFSTPPFVASQITKTRVNGDVYVPGFWRYVMLVVRNLPLRAFQRLKFLSGR